MVVSKDFLHLYMRHCEWLFDEVEEMVAQKNKLHGEMEENLGDSLQFR